MADRPVLNLLLGDVVRLRRRHPCGGDAWLVDRLGADIGLRCRTCERHVLIERPVLERRFASFAFSIASCTSGDCGRPTSPSDAERSYGPTMKPSTPS
ncbi:MAG: DUF951 domain-containing protein, partial [Candidatus Limnocylindrales bacterium]